MYNSIILPLAKEDIREAAKWYNKKSQGLGKRFTAEIREKVRFIRQNPTASNVRYDDVRTALLKGFRIYNYLTKRTKTICLLLWMPF